MVETVQEGKVLANLQSDDVNVDVENRDKTNDMIKAIINDAWIYKHGIIPESLKPPRNTMFKDGELCVLYWVPQKLLQKKKDILLEYKICMNSSTKEEENDAHKIYQGLNGGNDFKHREVYKILARELLWANQRDDGLNHAVNIPRNVARRTSDSSSLGNSVGSNDQSEVLDGPPILQSKGPNSDLDGSLYEGRSMPISQKLYRKNLVS
ncbi:hypothetical protein GIB67_018460 [Kingdonia uniflora]|uniref:Uncharacterized protein n=1 Tax=Kingdonia uniflora TaxID=39325 RepID=A0A7J7LJL1_9MAGN|nr:hypothetical protein GIB67_018460 [Kingdonia uniflora]